MKEIVINVGYGGFGLSAEAQKRYLELKGKKCFFYELTKVGKRTSDGKRESDEYRRLTLEEAIKAGGYADVVTEYLGERTEDIGGSPESKHPNVYWSRRYLIKRDDPELIKVVRELGENIHRCGASGMCSQLKIVKIPNGIDWEIQEHEGGAESIHEKHRSWV